MCCCPAWIKAPIGNLNDNTLEEIWNGPQARFTRQMMLEGRWQEICDPSCPVIISYLGTGRGNDYATQNPKKWITPQLAREIEAGKTLLDSTPTAYNLSNSHVCNIDCLMCDNKANTDGDPLIQKTLDQVIPLLPNTLEIIMTGAGDPFARPDTRRLLTEFDFSIYPNLRIGLLTNGQLLTQYWDRIRHQPFGWINVSVDGATKETYEKLRRRAKWEKLTEAFTTLRDKRPSSVPVVINMTVMKENYREIPLFIEMAEKYGFGCYFMTVRIPAEADIQPEQRFFDYPSSPELADFRRVVKECMSSKYSVSVGWGDLPGYLR